MHIIVFLTFVYSIKFDTSLVQFSTSVLLSDKSALFFFCDEILTMFSHVK